MSRPSTHAARLARALILQLFLLSALGTLRLAAQVPIPSGWDSTALALCDARLKMLLLLRDQDAATAATLAVSDPSFESTPIPLVLTGHPDRLRLMIDSAGGHVGAVIGEMMTATLPPDALASVARSGYLTRAELAPRVTLYNDSVRANVRAGQVLRGLPPLSGTATGKGVIIGIIDSGIDFRHPEFRMRRDRLATRVISIWSQGDRSGRPPESFGYGTEWRREQIQHACEEPASGEVQELDIVGHGTMVAATAAGLHGIAPEADIIVVQLRALGGAWDDLATDVMDAALYIYETAEALGRPCVINASLGSFEHLQDGSDAMARGIDAITAERPGRFFVAAAGNSGMMATHWSGGEKDTAVWTYCAGGATSFRVADSVVSRFELAIGIDSIAPDGTIRCIALTPFRSGLAFRALGMLVDSFPVTAGRAPRAAITAAAASKGTTEVRVACTPTGSRLFRLVVRGGAPFHAWGDRLLPRDSLPYAARAGIDDAYRPPDNLYTVATPAIARSVMGVGAYVNRAQYRNVRGEPRPRTPLVVGSLCDFSSRGPSVDGRIKPELIAPGALVLSARSRDIAYVDSSEMASDGSSIAGSGTSMASPAVAGAIALYLEKHPDATPDQVRRALVEHAAHDAASLSAGPLPNGAWGNGKLDVFATMTAEADPGAVPMPVQVYAPVPNPVAGTSAYIGYRIATDVAVELGVFDMLGRRLLLTRRGEEEAGYHELPLDLAGWPAGTYRIEVIAGADRAIGKMMLVR